MNQPQAASVESVHSFKWKPALSLNAVHVTNWGHGRMQKVRNWRPWELKEHIKNNELLIIYKRAATEEKWVLVQKIILPNLEIAMQCICKDPFLSEIFRNPITFSSIQTHL